MDILGPDGDRRRKRREKLLHGARIVSSDGMKTIGCVVRNRSDTGVLLQVENAFEIGDELLLVFDGEKRRRPAVVAWRKGNELGVQIVEPGREPVRNGNWVFPVGTGD